MKTLIAQITNMVDNRQTAGFWNSTDAVIDCLASMGASEIDLEPLIGRKVTPTPTETLCASPSVPQAPACPVPDETKTLAQMIEEAKHNPPQPKVRKTRNKEHQNV